MPSNESILEVYLHKVKERRTLYAQSRAVHDEILKLQKQLKTQIDFQRNCQDEINSIFQTKVTQLSNYRDFKDILNDAIFIGNQIQEKISMALEQVSQIEDAIGHVESALRAMKPYLKRGKVLNFERDRSQIQDCA